MTGGGTGTYHFEAASQVFTEVQPVSFLFMSSSGRTVLSFFSSQIITSIIIISLRLLFTLINERSFESFMCLDLIMVVVGGRM